MGFGVLLFSIILTLFCVLELCETSIQYFISHYKISTEDAINFLNSLQFPFSVKNRENILISIVKENQFEKFLTEIDKLEGRGWILIHRIFLASIIGTVQVFFGVLIIVNNDFLEKIIYISLFIANGVLFYNSWRFGHSLKSKAHHDISAME